MTRTLIATAALLSLSCAASAQTWNQRHGIERQPLPLSQPPASPPSRLPGSVFWQQINPGPVTVEESRSPQYQMMINKPPVR